MMMNKRLFILIFWGMCLFFILCSCSCEKDTDSSFISSSQSSGIKDNQNTPETPRVEEECDHLWYDVTVNTDTESTNTVILEGNCSLCTDFISKEVLTWVSYKEWGMAFSADGMKNFTVNNGINYTNYDENNASSQRVQNNIHTEEYFINSPYKNSSYYVNENFSGYSIMYGDFAYSNDKKAFVHKINDTSSIEIRFADKQLLSISTVSTDEGHTKTSTTYYLNQGKISVDVPEYFFERFDNMIKVDTLMTSSIGFSDAEKISEFLSSLTFDGRYEVAYTENGGLGVHFYFENEKTDPVFNGSYKEISIVAKDDRITELIIGNNTVEFTY